MYSYCSRAVVAIAVLLMTACSEQPKTPATATESSAASASSNPVPGKTAFFAMYKPAYGWANDVVPLKLESKEIPGIKNADGKAGMWSGTFGSYRKHEAVVISYAVAAHPPDIYKGINISNPIPWGGPSRDAMPFQSSDLATDSDAAYKTASAQAAAWLKKNPDKKVSFLLGNNPTRFSTPIWYVQWGDAKNGYGVFVSATTGALAKPGK
jgi:hypothetical protein